MPIKPLSLREVTVCMEYYQALRKNIIYQALGGSGLNIFLKNPIIKAGRYNIFPNTTVSELIERFEDGDVQLFKIAIIEGTVAKNNLVNLENIIEDQNLNFEVPQSVKDLFAEEALIMPDTYFFSDLKI